MNTNHNRILNNRILNFDFKLHWVYWLNSILMDFLIKDYTHLFQFDLIYIIKYSYLSQFSNKFIQSKFKNINLYFLQSKH